MPSRVGCLIVTERISSRNTERALRQAFTTMIAGQDERSFAIMVFALADPDTEEPPMTHGTDAATPEAAAAAQAAGVFDA